MDVGYMAAHGRVYRKLGKADSCAWGCEAELYDWANLTGRYEDPDDYAQMCRPCHAMFDGAVAKCAESVCKAGLHLLVRNEDYYTRTRPDGREQRQCKQCAKDRARKKG